MADNDLASMLAGTDVVAAMMGSRWDTEMLRTSLVTSAGRWEDRSEDKRLNKADMIIGS